MKRERESVFAMGFGTFHAETNYGGARASEIFFCTPHLAKFGNSLRIGSANSFACCRVGSRNCSYTVAKVRL